MALTRSHPPSIQQFWPLQISQKMHHALGITEILLDIFGHCRVGRKGAPDLLALATACRAFKGPALDVLWEDLDDLSPLVRCIPEACLGLSTEQEDASHTLFTGNKYLFSRPLTQDEWAILRSYTRRIRSIVEVKDRLDKECFKTLSNSPTDEPLFPNLRYLCCEYAAKAIPFLHLPFPSLISLDLVFGDMSVFLDFLERFPHSSPTFRRLSFRVRRLGDTLIKIDIDFISRWQNLQSVVCPQIDFDLNVLAHLASMPALFRLTYKQSVMLPVSDSDIVFHRLRYLTIYSAFLGPISRLLSQIRLPVVVDFTAIINSCPSKSKLASFWNSIDTANAAHTIENLTLDQSVPSMVTDRSTDQLPLDLEDLRPCMAQHHLSRLKLNVAWNVALKDSDIHAIASAWPSLEHLALNTYSGWNTSTGITLPGLLQLLQTCPSLRWVALAVDTRDYTALPLTGPSSIFGPEWSPSRQLFIDVLDSPIAAKSVIAIADFFSRIIPGADVSFSAWRSSKMVRPEGWQTYKTRWENVFRFARRPSAFLSHRMVGAAVERVGDGFETWHRTGTGTTAAVELR